MASAPLALTPIAAAQAAPWDRWFGPLTWAKVDAMIEADFPATPFWTTEQLARTLSQDPRSVFLVDTRTAEEFAVSHLPGAQRFESSREAAKVWPSGTQLVAYCSVGYRSAQWIKELRQQGRTDCFNLKGSLFAWANEGRSLYANGQLVRVAHPYNKRWGALLNPELHAKV